MDPLEDELMELVRKAMQARSRRMAERVVGLTDENEVRHVLREEMRDLLKELQLDVASDPDAQLRLDAAVGEAFAEMNRLSKDWPDAEK